MYWLITLCTDCILMYWLITFMYWLNHNFYVALFILHSQADMVHLCVYSACWVVLCSLNSPILQHRRQDLQRVCVCVCLLFLACVCNTLCGGALVQHRWHQVQFAAACPLASCWSASVAGVWDDGDWSPFSPATELGVVLNPHRLQVSRGNVPACSSHPAVWFEPLR